MTKFLIFFKSIPRPFWLALLSGVLVGTSYIPFYGWALLFCYSPLWLAATEILGSEKSIYKKMKSIFWSAWLTQFILTLIGFNWIYYVSSEFGLLPMSLSAAALFLFASLMHIYIPLALLCSGFLIEKLKIKNVSVQFILFALGLSFFERVWPSIFEWNLAYSLLWMKWPLYQWADSVGFWGLSTWILLFQAFITSAIFSFKAERKKSIETLVATIAVIIALSGLGLLKEKNWSHFDESVQFGVAQANVGNTDKIQSEKKQNFHSYILNLYKDLTHKQLSVAPQTEIMLWPETALPFPLDQDFLNRFEQRDLLTSVSQWKIPLITGGYSLDLQHKDHLGNPQISNSVFFVGPQSAMIAEEYNKTDLLVFGEYMPFGKELPFLYQLLPFVGNFKIGPGPVAREVQLADKKIILGPQICYESLNPEFSRGLAIKGAQILFNVTNDSWFGWWAEPFQHQFMTLARAIEVRRPLVRSTNTGVTSVILANGENLENSPINKAWSHTYEVKYLKKAPLSLYTKWGHYDWIFWLIVFAGLILFYRNKDTNV